MRKILLCFMALIMLTFSVSGCFTMMHQEGGMSTVTHRESKLLLSDTLVALGKPDAQTSALLGNSSTLALFGQKHTYLLSKGGDALIKITQGFANNAALDADHLSIDNQKKSLYLDENTAWGRVNFLYFLSEDAAKRAMEEAVLKSLGFEVAEISGYAAHISIPVEAAVKPAVDLSKVQLPTFKKNRDLEFYESDSKTTTTKPNLGKMLLLPFTVVADIVTAPVQLIGLGVVMYALKDGLKF